MKFAFGVCAGPSDRLEKICLPALQRFCPDVDVLVRRGESSIASAYNSMIAESIEGGFDAVIFIHDDVELKEDPRPAIERCVVEHEDAAVIGVVGSTGAQFHWWPDGDPRGYAVDTRQEFDYGGGTHVVDVVDGLFLAMSRWALQNLRFDPSIGRWHGYDSDICWQARAAGQQVLVTDVALFHHARPLQGYDLRPFEQAKAAFLLKWHPEASRRRRLGWQILTTVLGQRTKTALGQTTRFLRAMHSRSKFASH